MTITTPKGKTIRIMRNGDLALEKVKDAETIIDSLAIITVNNSKGILVNAVIGGAALGLACRVHHKISKLTKKVAELEAAETKVEEE